MERKRNILGMLGRIFFKGKPEPPQHGEETFYSPNTHWKVERRSLSVSGDMANGTRREAEWLVRRFDGVTISINSKGDVEFAIRPPFNDIPQEKVQELIKKARSHFDESAKWN